MKFKELFTEGLAKGGNFDFNIDLDKPLNTKEIKRLKSLRKMMKKGKKVLLAEPIKFGREALGSYTEEYDNLVQRESNV